MSDLEKVIDCPRCGGLGCLPIGKCSICEGYGRNEKREIIENFQYLKHSHEECWGTEFKIPDEFKPENNPDYGGDVLTHIFD